MPPLAQLHPRTPTHRPTACLPQLLAFVRKWRKFNSDLPALLDEWAGSLFRELDYRHEAANGVRFRELYGHLEVSFRACA
jgi:predicted unusual protein kinase regulating ubiquinone biosynthesis (AarF/ABC1/UbiB family)